MHITKIVSEYPVMWIPLHRTPSFVVFKKPKIESNANFLDEPKTKKLNCKNV